MFISPMGASQSITAESRGAAADTIALTGACHTPSLPIGNEHECSVSHCVVLMIHRSPRISA